MSLGLKVFTLFHVALSLIGIVSGLVVYFGLIKANWHKGTNTVFLVTTIATSVTGFLFPFHGFDPAIGVGILSMILLAVAVFALYSRGLAGGWRRTYVISAGIALYFNFFVLIAQSFQKIPALKALAPTQTEAPFKIAQAIALICFIALGVLAAKGFRADRLSAA